MENRVKILLFSFVVLWLALVFYYFVFEEDDRVIKSKSNVGNVSEPEPQADNDTYEIEQHTFTSSQLIYDASTYIVYIRNYTFSSNIVYTLYLSENGKPCRYINGQIIEINE